MKRPVHAYIALFVGSCALSWWSVGPNAVQAAWPTYRHDSRRSGASSEELTLPLQEAWNHKAAQTPRPAWPELPAVKDVFRRVNPLGPTTTFDRALHVAVAAGRVYYGSSADDSIYCLDATTGSILWSFTTEGPVRLAPVVVDGKVYAGSDDGCVYCLKADDGQLVWRHRGGPEDRRVPGNERMISMWPVRCGVVVEEGTVYFCAGLFPTQGCYLCAIRASDGSELWKQPIEISPQGYLLASASRLFAPTGRTAPYAFARADGKAAGQFPGAGPNSRTGGCFAVLLDDTTAYSGGEVGGIHFAAPGAKEKLVFADGQRLVASGPVSYILSKDRLCALDRVTYLELSRLRAKKQKTGADQQRIRELSAKGHMKWEISCPDAYELILAGSTIVVGGTDRVMAYRTQDGSPAWTGTVAGKAYGLAASDGALFVSTDKGNVHCFQPGVKGSRAPFVAMPAMPPQSPYPVDDLTPRYQQAAEAALAAVDARKGYCLVLGAGQGRLAYEIARRSQFQVVGVEPDAAHASEARRRLLQAGLCGTRISIHHGALDRLPYGKHFANLVVCEETLVSGKLPPSAAEVYRVLRPYGGAVVLTAPPGADGATALARWGKGAIPGWSVATAAPGGSFGKATRGPLAGAGQWSHLYADAGNTACSNDALPHGPMDVQWFGRPGPRRMPDRHDKNMAPLCRNGRVFVTGDNYVAAVDAYNGTVLWERDVPESVRLGAFKHSGSMAASDDSLYVASGSDCLGVDAQTGRHRLTLSVPPAADGASREWGYVAVVDDLLFGSVCRQGAAFREQTIDTEVLIWRDFMPVICSDSVFAHDRRSGKQLWNYEPGQGVIINPTIAVGGGRMYFVESTNPQTRLVADGRMKLDMLLGRGANLVALDTRTGKTLWKRAAALEQLQHIVYLSYAKEKLVITGTKNVPVNGKERVRYDLSAFDAATGNRLWQTTETPVPDHILQGPHGEQVQHSAIVGDTIYNSGFTVSLQTGEPVSGWKWQKSGNCGVLATSASCGFSRFDTARMFNLKTGESSALTKVIRPGCWINMLPAGGLILMPEASAGCTCGYSIQTSIALTPRDG